MHGLLSSVYVTSLGVLMVGAPRAIDLRNRIIHGNDALDDEIVYFTATDDLSGLHADLAQLLAARGWPSFQKICHDTGMAAI